MEVIFPQVKNLTKSNIPSPGQQRFTGISQQHGHLVEHAGRNSRWNLIGCEAPFPALQSQLSQ